MDSEGIQNGWTRKVLIKTAITRAVNRSPGNSAQNERFFFAGFSGLAPSGRVSLSGSISFPSR
jgi:hypothetical protein